MYCLLRLALLKNLILVLLLKKIVLLSDLYLLSKFQRVEWLDVLLVLFFTALDIRYFLVISSCSRHIWLYMGCFNYLWFLLFFLWVFWVSLLFIFYFSSYFINMDLFFIFIFIIFNIYSIIFHWIKLTSYLFGT